MTSWKYTVNDAKSCAFTPMPTKSVAGSSHGLIKINGQPGTQAVMVEKPSALRPPCQNELRQSMAAPDVIYPSLYWVKTLITAPYKVVRRISTHEVPIPARRAYVTPVPLAKRAKIGGATAMSWPPAPQNFTGNSAVPGV